MRVAESKLGRARAPRPGTRSEGVESRPRSALGPGLEPESGLDAELVPTQGVTEFLLGSGAGKERVTQSRSDEKGLRRRLCAASGPEGVGVKRGCQAQPPEDGGEHGSRTREEEEEEGDEPLPSRRPRALLLGREGDGKQAGDVEGGGCHGGLLQGIALPQPGVGVLEPSKQTSPAPLVTAKA